MIANLFKTLSKTQSSTTFPESVDHFFAGEGSLKSYRTCADDQDCLGYNGRCGVHFMISSS
jgi:hypothetical protein